MRTIIQRLLLVGILGCFCGSRVQAEDVPSAEKIAEYRQAADQGEADAQYNLGLCYYKGEGVRKDQAEAVKWFRKAAEQGHVKGQCNLGVCYDNGEGVPKDDAEAVKWFARPPNKAMPWHNTTWRFAMIMARAFPRMMRKH